MRSEARTGLIVPPARTAVPASRYLVFGGIALCGCAVDLITKRLVFDWRGMPYARPSWWIVDETFGVTTSLNEGALFGIGQGQQFIFSLLSVAAATAIIYWLFVAKAAQDLWLTVALAAVLGGIFGNLYDRLGIPGLHWALASAHEVGEPVYAVRDWLHFKIDGLIDWPIFNIADSLLVCGAILLVWHALRVEQSHVLDPSDAKRHAPQPVVSDAEK
jgi:signal peptidase II